MRDGGEMEQRRKREPWWTDCLTKRRVSARLGNRKQAWAQGRLRGSHLVAF